VKTISQLMVLLDFAALIVDKAQHLSVIHKAPEESDAYRTPHGTAKRDKAENGRGREQPLASGSHLVSQKPTASLMNR
jgi:hypothetical protein